MTDIINTETILAELDVTKYVIDTTGRSDKIVDDFSSVLQYITESPTLFLQRRK